MVAFTSRYQVNTSMGEYLILDFVDDRVVRLTPEQITYFKAERKRLGMLEGCDRSIDLMLNKLCATFFTREKELA